MASLDAMCPLRFLRTDGAVLALASALVSPAALALNTQLVAPGFTAPLYLTAPEGDPRLFVVEQGGFVKVHSGGTWSTFLDIHRQVDTSGERGLLGLAFDPNYAVKGAPGFGTFYVDYIDHATKNTQISRFTVSSNPNVANPVGAPILTIAQPPGRNNHKAGWIAFRPGDQNDLYVATGDGGSSYDPDNNAQNTHRMLGKVLRLNVRSDAFPNDAARNYAIPTGNPFASGGGAPEVWDYGLRNPYRDSFDRGSGAFYIGDVGQGTREEIDFEAASNAGGNNYGWRLREGKIATPKGGVGGDAPGAVDPIYDYAHDTSPFGGVAVIGGYVYRGSLLKNIQGEYFFGDLSGRIWSLRIDSAGKMVPGSLVDLTAELNPLGRLATISSFGEDGLGNLYILDYRGGKVFEVVPEPSAYLILMGGLGLLWLALRRGPYKQRMDLGAS